jgi:hypothetical protein
VIGLVRELPGLVPQCEGFGRVRELHGICLAPVLRGLSRVDPGLPSVALRGVEEGPDLPRLSVRPGKAKGVRVAVVYPKLA